jgi:UDP-N-acetylglucosamine 1-carboxyvinyltransferase
MTWICASVVTRSPLQVRAFDAALVQDALRYEAPYFDAMGIELAWRERDVSIRPPEIVLPIAVEAEVRGVSTDNHPFFTLMLTFAAGPSTVTDRVWRHRFGYVECLNRLGTDLTITPPSVRVAPSCPYVADQVLAPSDTRAAAVSLLAALSVPGRTRIRCLSHLHRGYERLPSKLRSLGAQIGPAE